MSLLFFDCVLRRTILVHESFARAHTLSRSSSTFSRDCAYQQQDASTGSDAQRGRFVPRNHTPSAEAALASETVALNSDNFGLDFQSPVRTSTRNADLPKPKSERNEKNSKAPLISVSNDPLGGTSTTAATPLSQPKKANTLSSTSRESLLSTLSPDLRTQIECGLLFNNDLFSRMMSSGAFELWEQKALASLIEDEIDRNKPASHTSVRVLVRQRNLLANAGITRMNIPSGNNAPSAVHDLSLRKSHESPLITEELLLLRKWEVTNEKKLQLLRKQRLLSGADRARKRSLEVLQCQLAERRKILRAVVPPDASRRREIDSSINSSPTDPVRITASDLSTFITLGPVSLPYILHHQLARDVLDRLNQACFLFGKRNASRLMETYQWTCPQNMDLQIFFYSFNFFDPKHPDVYNIRVRSFRRLRLFRNQYAHGSAEMSVAGLINVMKSLRTIAMLLQSQDLMTVSKEYRALLEDFIAIQSPYSTRVAARAQRGIEHVKNTFKAKSKKSNTAARESQDDILAISANQHISPKVLKEATQIKDAWKTTEHDLAMYSARKLRRYVGESQIRHTLDLMGENPRRVLDAVHSEYAEKDGQATLATDSSEVDAIFASFERKLSEVLTTNLADETTDNQILAAALKNDTGPSSSKTLVDLLSTPSLQENPYLYHIYGPSEAAIPTGTRISSIVSRKHKYAPVSTGIKLTSWQRLKQQLEGNTKTTESTGDGWAAPLKQVMLSSNPAPTPSTGPSLSHSFSPSMDTGCTVWRRPQIRRAGRANRRPSLRVASRNETLQDAREHRRRVRQIRLEPTRSPTPDTKPAGSPGPPSFQAAPPDIVKSDEGSRTPTRRVTQQKPPLFSFEPSDVCVDYTGAKR